MAAELEKRELELRYQFKFRLADMLSKALDQLIPGIFIFLVVYFGIYRTAHELAGRETLARFTLFADVRPDEIISYAAAMVGWVFGVNAQRLRRNSTARLTGRIQELESRLDPSRTSSGLTSRGKTPPEVK